MHYLHSIDWTVIAIYFSILVGLGFYLQKKAGASIEDYFLGGRSIPWWAMGISGMATWLDITGTMLIVSFLYMLGPRGLYIEFRGGAVLVLAFMLVFTGKWHYRSKCITAAEWNIFRFGKSAGGQFTRIAAAIGMFIGTVGMLAYMVKGVGLFLSTFLPFSPTTCAIGMLGIATIYTMASGFYGVIYTDLFQSVIILIGVIFITTLAITSIGNYDGELAVLAEQVTGSSQWTNTAIQLETEMPKGYEQYRHLFMFAMFYLIRNVFGGLGSGGDPRYFGARNERECGKLSFLWGWLMMFRWPMMMGFAVLGLFLVHELLPDKTVIASAADAIKHSIGQIPENRWEDVVSGIVHSPDQHPELVTQLKEILGADQWASKMKLISYHGTVNPERILPAVLLAKVPVGMRGLLLVALIAASMSTFDSTVNMATGYFTRDIYQAFIKPGASTKELIYVSYIFGVIIVAIGFLMGLATDNVNDIWGWIIMCFGAAGLAPAVLRLYWWRLNAGGVIGGMIIGMPASVVLRFYHKSLEANVPEWFGVQWDEITQFCVMFSISIVSTVVGTYLTEPTDRPTLKEFYRRTRPFGFWGPLWSLLTEQEKKTLRREHINDIVAIPFALLWQITLFMLPMQMVIRAWDDFYITLGLFLTGLAGMYWFWWRNLPPADHDPVIPELIDTPSMKQP